MDTKKPPQPLSFIRTYSKWFSSTSGLNAHLSDSHQAFGLVTYKSKLFAPHIGYATSMCIHIIHAFKVYTSHNCYRKLRSPRRLSVLPVALLICSNAFTKRNSLRIDRRRFLKMNRLSNIIILKYFSSLVFKFMPVV